MAEKNWEAILMAKKDIWMPLNIGDYIADTMSLTAEQHGVYLLLLMDYWKSGPLADDDAQLASTGKVPLKEWKAKIGPVIRRFFRKAEDGLLHQKRADMEIAKTGRISDARRSAAMERHTRPAKQSLPNDKTGCKPDANAPTNRIENSEQSPLDTGCKPGDITRVYALAPPSPSQSKEESGSLRSPAPSALTVPDARDRLWGTGLPALQAMTGLPGPKVRAMLGKLVKEARDDCALVMTVLDEAQSVRPMDPYPWIREAIMARSDRREGVGEQLARELDFSINDLPGFNGVSDVRQSHNHPQLAHSIETSDQADDGTSDP